MNALPCPHREVLFGYVVGTISEDEAEVVTQHLDACHECERTVQALEGLSDTMISALRQPAHGDAYAEEPECGQVLEKLRLLQIGRPESSGLQAPVSPPKKARGTTLGDYELLKKLGAGGMGAVYKARHTRLKRVVALKVLRKDCLGNEQLLARFEREMEAVGRLDHPNIVRAMDAREVGGTRFLAMEYVDGLDFSEVVVRCGPLGIPDACEAICQAALGLQCSQENGLVHRDVKPSNLMLSSEGQVKLLDLGLAHIQEAEALEGEVTGIGQIMGTPDYMSPEQCMESHTVDIRSDVYSLGCTLYYLLTGRPPFGGTEYDTPMQKVTGHIRDAVPTIHSLRPDVPKPIAVLIERMLAKDLNQRIASPAEVVNALAPFCKGSKLIGLLRGAKANEEEEKGRQSHIETSELQASAIVDTSRDELTPEGKEEKPSGSDEFNPYHRWLGIPPKEQPPNHYRLLGLALFEDDPEVVHDAAARQMAHVRTYHLGQHAELSQEILDELGAAKACLLNPQKKMAYDAELRKEQSSGAVEEQERSDSPSSPAEFPILVDKPGSRVTRTRSRFGIRKPPAPRWIAIGAAALFFLFGVVLYISTGKGHIKIILNDPKAEVEVKINGDDIEITGLDDPILLQPGTHELVVSGPKYETVCQSFTVRRGDNKPLEVTLVPLASETPVVPTPGEPLQDGGVKDGLPAKRAVAGVQPLLITDDQIPMAATKQPTTLPDAPVGSPIRWLGYWEKADEPDIVPTIATHTNLLMIDGFPENSPIKTLEGARKAGLPVVLNFHNTDRQGIEDQLVSFLRDYQDVVAAVCWVSPYWDGYANPKELAEFGRWIKQTFPGIQFWSTFVERPKGKPQTLPVPPEVDALVVTHWFDPTPDQVRNKFNRNISNWLNKAQGRPVLLAWMSYDPPPGLVPRCESGTLRMCGQMAKEKGLTGLLFSSYGDQKNGIVGIHSNTTLVDEIKEIAREWKFAPIAVPPGPGGKPLQTDEVKARIPAEGAKSELGEESHGAPNTLTEAELAEGWKLLFDGKTLNGWHAIGGGNWSVENGAIVGRKPGAQQAGDHGSHLVTDSDYDDFTLRLKFNVPWGDSGVYFRGTEGGFCGFIGLQTQIKPPDDVGGLWNVTSDIAHATLRVSSPARASQRMFRKHDWNELELIAKGRHVSIYINSVPTAAVQDEHVYRSGRIAIQLWGEKDTEVRVKDIRIRPETETQLIQIDQAPRGGPPEKATRWLGYDVLGSEPVISPGEVARFVNQVASHSNIVVVPFVDHYAEPSIQTARERGLKVLLYVWTRESMTRFNAEGIQLVKDNSDVVVGVLSCSPPYFRIEPSEIAKFAQNLKRACPGIEYWVSLVDNAPDSLDYALPDEVDVLSVHFFDSSTIGDVKRRKEEVWPKWIAKAGRRPVVLLWHSWPGAGISLVSKCELGTFKAVGRAVEELNLKGLFFLSYCDTRWKGNVYTGIASRPALVAEVRSIAREWRLP